MTLASQQAKRINHAVRLYEEALIDAWKRDRRAHSHLPVPNDEDISAVPVVRALAEFDPTPTKSYLSWIAREYSRRHFLLEDRERIYRNLSDVIAFKGAAARAGDPINLSSLSAADLSRRLSQIAAVPELPDVDLSDASADEIVVHYAGVHGSLITPLTKEAAQRVGHGTQWCTSAQNGNMFESYHSEDTPLYILRAPGGFKCQLWFGPDTIQIKDEHDGDLSEEQLSALWKNPAVEALLLKVVQDRLKMGARVAENFWMELSQYDSLPDRVVDALQEQPYFLAAQVMAGRAVYHWTMDDVLLRSTRAALIVAWKSKDAQHLLSSLGPITDPDMAPQAVRLSAHARIPLSREREQELLNTYPRFYATYLVAHERTPDTAELVRLCDRTSIDILMQHFRTQLKRCEADILREPLPAATYISTLVHRMELRRGNNERFHDLTEQAIPGISAASARVKDEALSLLARAIERSGIPPSPALYDLFQTLPWQAVNLALLGYKERPEEITLPGPAML